MTSPEMIADPLVGEGCEKRPLWPASGRGYAWGEEAHQNSEIEGPLEDCRLPHLHRLPSTGIFEETQ